LRLFGGERSAVLSNDAVDANAVDGEALGVGCGGLLQVAVAGEILLLDVDVVGVVLVVRLRRPSRFVRRRGGVRGLAGRAERQRVERLGF